MMSDPTNHSNQTIELQHPISIDGVQVKTLRLRRPKVRDMLTVETTTGHDAEKEIQLFAHLCEVNPIDLHELDMADYAKLQQAYQSFLS
jgi:hypothetical protein